MGKTIAIPTPNGGIAHLTEEQLVVAGIGAELAASADSCTRTARVRYEVGSAQWAGVIAGLEEELGILGDRVHDARRALRAWREEQQEPGSTFAPTRRDIAVKRAPLSRRLAVAMTALAALVAAAAAAIKAWRGLP